MPIFAFGLCIRAFIQPSIIQQQLFQVCQFFNRLTTHAQPKKRLSAQCVSAPVARFFGHGWHAAVFSYFFAMGKMAGGLGSIVSIGW